MEILSNVNKYTNAYPTYCFYHQQLGNKALSCSFPTGNVRAGQNKPIQLDTMLFFLPISVIIFTFSFAVYVDIVFNFESVKSFG